MLQYVYYATNGTHIVSSLCHMSTIINLYTQPCIICIHNHAIGPSLILYTQPCYSSLMFTLIHMHAVIIKAFLRKDSLYYTSYIAYYTSYSLFLNVRDISLSCYCLVIMERLTVSYIHNHNNRYLQLPYILP